MRGGAYEGEGGPEDKTARRYQQNPGGMEEGTIKDWGKDPRKVEGETVNRERTDLSSLDEQREQQPIREGGGAQRGEVLERGRLAAKANLGMDDTSREELPAQGSKGSQYRGADWEAPEGVPDAHADQGEIPPESVIGHSKRAQEY